MLKFLVKVFRTLLQGFAVGGSVTVICFWCDSKFCLWVSGVFLRVSRFCHTFLFLYVKRLRSLSERYKCLWCRLGKEKGGKIGKIEISGYSRKKKKKKIPVCIFESSLGNKPIWLQ